MLSVKWILLMRFLLSPAKTLFHAKYLKSKQQNPNGFIDTSYKLFSKVRHLNMRFAQRRGSLLLPTNLNVELTTLCNLRCSYCVHKEMKTFGNMNQKTIRVVVKEFQHISEQQATTFAPVGVGEPLLFKDFFKVLKWFRNAMPNTPTFVITNGVTLDEANSKKVVGSGVERFLVSVNFSDRNAYLKYNGVDKYDSVVENTKAFLKIKGNRTPSTSIQMLDVMANKHRFQSFIKQWTPHINRNDVVALKVCDNWTGTIDRTKFTDTKPPKRYPCPMLYSMVIVNSEGYVFPCCQGMTRGEDSPVCLGHILKKTLNQIYTKEDTIWNLRRLHEQGLYDGLPCRECFAWSMVPNIFFF